MPHRAALRRKPRFRRAAFVQLGGFDVGLPGGSHDGGFGGGSECWLVSTADPGVETRAANWGVPGVAAVLIEDGSVRVWGHSGQAVELQLESLAKEGIGSTVDR